MRPQQQRGRERRAALIQAAAEIAATDGFGAVSHRSVATRAGVPLGSTTYYFRSLDDLLGEVAGELVNECQIRATEVVRTAPPGPFQPDQAAELLARAVLPGEDFPRVLSYYEQLLSAARHPAVAAALSAARPRLEQMVRQALTKTGYAEAVSSDLTLAVVDGAALSALSEGRSDVVGFVAEIVTELLRPRRPRSIRQQ